MSLTIRTTLEGADPAGTLFLPALRGLEGPDLDLLAMLPVCDVNGALLEALNGRAPWPAAAPAPTVGLFLLDPFVRLPVLAERLRAAGVRRVANYPSVQALEGETARGLASVGFSPVEEFAALREMRALGFEIVGFAYGAAAARELAALGASSVVLHPGPGDPDGRQREALGALAAWLKPELAARGVALHLFSPREAASRAA